MFQFRCRNCLLYFLLFLLVQSELNKFLGGPTRNVLSANWAAPEAKAERAIIGQRLKQKQREQLLGSACSKSRESNYWAAPAAKAERAIIGQRLKQKQREQLLDSAWSKSRESNFKISLHWMVHTMTNDFYYLLQTIDDVLLPTGTTVCCRLLTMCYSLLVLLYAADYWRCATPYWYYYVLQTIDDVLLPTGTTMCCRLSTMCYSLLVLLCAADYWRCATPYLYYCLLQTIDDVLLPTCTIVFSSKNNFK